jgi:hypothetical protein
MRVLVTETDRHAADAAVAAIEAAGHEVVRCHDPEWQAFPCVGAAGDGHCPVEDGVDVALVTRTGVNSMPAAFEDGARCAVRAAVPIVVAGIPSANPFRRWTVATADLADPVPALEAAIRAPHPHLTANTQSRLSARVQADGGDPAATWAVAYRRAGRVTVEYDAPGPHAAHYAVWLAAAVRELDPEARTIDVAYTPGQRRALLTVRDGE